MPRWPKRVRGMEKSKRARRRKPETAKADLEPTLVVLRRAGCPPRGGIRRACGELPGRSQRGLLHRRTGRPKMGQGRACTMEAKALLIHPSRQGVCGRHGREDQYVTPGGLAGSTGGAVVSDPISGKAKWEVRRSESSDGRIVPEARRKPGDRESGNREWIGEGDRRRLEGRERRRDE